MTTTFLDSYQRTAWTKTQLFDLYETQRRFTRAALQKTTRDAVLPKIPKQAVVLEYGAGSGELRNRLIGNKLQNDVTWIETEQNPKFLALNRQYPSLKVSAKLPRLPFKDKTADLVTGYGVLDTIPSEKLPEALAELYRVCKTDGRLIEQLDLSIDPGDIFIKAERAGKIPFFSYGEIFPKVSGRTGIVFIDKEKLEAQLQKWLKHPILKGIVPFFTLYKDSPLEATLRLESNGNERMTRSLYEQIKEAGLIDGEEVSLTDFYRHSLESAAKSAGFEIEHSGNVRSEIIVDRNELPDFPYDKNTLLHKNGAMFFKNDPELRDRTKVKLDVRSLVFVARKGLQSL